MKNLKLLIFSICILFIGQVCSANILPVSVSDIPKESIGVFQADKSIVIYSRPDETSPIVYYREMNYKDFTDVKSDNLFGILIPDKELGYAYITDVAEDENWVQVVYNKENNLKGWIYKQDDFQFLPWGIFFDMYGRKYGLYTLKNPPIDYNEIFSQPSLSGQLMGRITSTKFMRMTSIEGTWMLVSVLDYTDTVTTGYVRWRTEEGEILLFPHIK